MKTAWWHLQCWYLLCKIGWVKWSRPDGYPFDAMNEHFIEGDSPKEAVEIEISYAD